MSEKDGIMLAIECVNRHNHGFIKCHPMFIRGHNEAVKAITKELRSLIETGAVSDGDYFEGFSEGIKVGRNEMIEAIEALTAERDALLARLAPVDDKALVEKAAHFEAKFDGWPFSVLERLTQDLYRLRARDFLAAIRPHIEAAERERCARIADSGMLPCDIGGDLILDRYTADTIAAAIRNQKEK